MYEPLMHIMKMALSNFEDENTCILRIDLTDGILYADGTQYNIDFTEDKNY